MAQALRPVDGMNEAALRTQNALLQNLLRTMSARVHELDGEVEGLEEQLRATTSILQSMQTPHEEAL
jgi:uncharacterized protein YlxW (UPF0749 family)